MKEKGRILDEVVSVTGWSRDNVRQRLVAAARPPGPGRQVAERVREPQPAKYFCDAFKVLQRVWAASGVRSPWQQPKQPRKREQKQMRHASPSTRAS